MPIYEYVCQSCANRFEVKQKVSDPPVAGCLRCGQPVTKVISAPAIMFKGTGWYVTDYSDKLKPTGSSESTGAPANGQGTQKPADTSKETASPAAAAASSSPSTPAAPSGGGTSTSGGSSSGSTTGSSASASPAGSSAQ